MVGVTRDLVVRVALVAEPVVTTVLLAARASLIKDLTVERAMAVALTVAVAVAVVLVTPVTLAVVAPLFLLQLQALP